MATLISVGNNSLGNTTNYWMYTLFTPTQDLRVTSMSIWREYSSDAELNYFWGDIDIDPPTYNGGILDSDSLNVNGATKWFTIPTGTANKAFGTVTPFTSFVMFAGQTYYFGQTRAVGALWTSGFGWAGTDTASFSGSPDIFSNGKRNAYPTSGGYNADSTYINRFIMYGEAGSIPYQTTIVV